MKRKRLEGKDKVEPDEKKRKLKNEFFDEDESSFKYGKSLLDSIYLLDEKERCIKLKKELGPYSFFQERENEYKERNWRLARLAAFYGYEEHEMTENFSMYQNQLGLMYHEEWSIPYNERLEKNFKKLLESEKVKDIVHYMDEMYLFSKNVKKRIRWLLKDVTGIDYDIVKAIAIAFAGEGEKIFKDPKDVKSQ